VLIGLLFILTPGLVDKFGTFFKDIKLVNVTSVENVMLPAPEHVAQHLEVYSAVEQFSLGWGVFLVAMLVVRFAIGSPNRRKAENLSDIIFWFGAAYLIQTWLINNAKWFEFWATILIVLGVSLVVRAIYLAAVALRK
jgi:hypothetical protein